MPDVKAVGPDRAICVGCQEMAAWMKVAVNERVSGKEALRLLARLEPLHLPFPASCRSMRVLRTVVEISALPMFDSRKQLTFRHTVAPQLVGHDHPRHIVQTRQQASEETLGCLAVAACLNEDVEHNAILIHGAPQITLHALDPDEHLVQVPLVPGPWPPCRRLAKLWPNFLHQRRTVS